MPLGKRFCRPSRQRSPSIASMMTTGSVRGKCCVLQTSHSRRQPAAVDAASAGRIARRSHGACASRARPWPRRAARRRPAATRPCIAIERRSMSSRSSRPGMTSSRRSRKPSLASPRISTALSSSRAANTGGRHRRRRAALRARRRRARRVRHRESGSVAARPRVSTGISRPIKDRPRRRRAR